MWRVVHLLICHGLTSQKELKSFAKEQPFPNKVVHQLSVNAQTSHIVLDLTSFSFFWLLAIDVQITLQFSLCCVESTPVHKDQYTFDAFSVSDMITSIFVNDKS